MYLPRTISEKKEKNIIRLFTYYSMFFVVMREDKGAFQTNEDFQEYKNCIDSVRTVC